MIFFDRCWYNQKKNKGSPEEEDAVFGIRYLDEDHLEEMMSLQDVIVQNLEDKEIFRTHSIDYFKDLFQVEKAAIGASTEEGLIVCSILQFPEEIEDNYGADVNLPIDDLSRVVHLAKVAVHPAFRGNSLQRKLGFRLELLRDDFEISYGRVQALRSIPEFQYSNHCMSSDRRSFVSLAAR